MKNKVEIYSNDEYLTNNPNWHTEDSPWKALQILKIVAKNKLKPKTICELGCGAGQILNELSKNIEGCQFIGYEISKTAYDFCKSIKNDTLTFYYEDLLREENKAFFDVLLVIDVVEHIEDFFSFLRKSKKKATYKIFHIPLELTAQSILRMNPILNGRKKYGHIHYYTKDLALEALKDCGYEIVDWMYTDWDKDLLRNTVKQKLKSVPRMLVSSFNKDLSVRCFGGSSLLVLAK